MDDATFTSLNFAIKAAVLFFVVVYLFCFVLNGLA